MALLTARCSFVGTNLTYSIKGEAESNLVATVEKFRQYFAENCPGKRISTIELFLQELDMHLEKPPFHTTTFG